MNPNVHERFGPSLHYISKHIKKRNMKLNVDLHLSIDLI